jgi:DNA-binding LacI/PurR family transcriptional regulator
VNGRRVGIKDVADAAGVSITTVSHALSGKGRLPDATRERVQAIARELGYSPHPSARSLASGRTGMVAIVVSAPGDEPIPFTDISYYVDLINAATRASVERGSALVIAPTGADHEIWARIPLDGVIVVDPADGDETIGLLRDRRIPMVFVGRDRHGTPDDVVVQNDRGAATRSVLAHLEAAGADTVGILTLRSFESFTEECLGAYLAWCGERGADPVAHVADADPTADPAALREVACAFLERADRPQAVFCLYERLAIELLAVARETGTSVPEDLLVATIDEIGMAPVADPPLTTLGISQDALGARAAELLIDLLEGEEAAPTLDVPTHLIVRRSTERVAPSSV